MESFFASSGQMYPTHCFQLLAWITAFGFWQHPVWTHRSVKYIVVITFETELFSMLSTFIIVRLFHWPSTNLRILYKKQLHDLRRWSLCWFNICFDFSSSNNHHNISRQKHFVHKYLICVVLHNWRHLDWTRVCKIAKFVVEACYQSSHQEIEYLQWNNQSEALFCQLWWIVVTLMFSTVLVKTQIVFVLTQVGKFSLQHISILVK